MELEQLAAQASQVMKEAGAVIRAIPRPKIYTKEGHANFVTEGDVASQNYLMEHLSPLLPEAHFFAEEQEENQLAPGYNWVIDPIDGTTNFIRGYQSWCISVGLVLDGEGLLGLVLDLASGDLYSGIRGKGAFRNGEPIHVADVPPENALVVFGTSPYYPELRRHHFCHGKGTLHPLWGLAAERFRCTGLVPSGRWLLRRLLRAAPLPLGLRGRVGDPAGSRRADWHCPWERLPLR